MIIVFNHFELKNFGKNFSVAETISNSRSDSHYMNNIYSKPIG